MYFERNKKINTTDKKTKLFFFVPFIILIVAQIILFLFIYLNRGPTHDEINSPSPIIQSGSTILKKGSNKLSNRNSKSSPTDWMIWNRRSILGSSHKDVHCRWIDYHITTSSKRYETSNTINMQNDKENMDVLNICAKAHIDAISDEISKTGSWSHCESLPHFWKESLFKHNMQSNEYKDSNSEDKPDFERQSDRFYIDIGAGIGACVFEMLLTTDAKILAFEPNPDNLFYLTTSLMALSPSLRNRVYLYPVALGDHSSSSSSSSSITHNNKDSQRMFQRNSSLRTHSAHFVMERLDQIIDINSPTLHNKGEILKEAPMSIPLVKINTEGYECQILHGMRQLLPHIQTLIFTVDQTILSAYKCDTRFIFDVLNDFGYKLFVFEEKMNMEREIQSPLIRREYDLIARKMN